MAKLYRKSTTRRRLFATGLLVGNLLLVSGVSAFLLQGRPSTTPNAAALVSKTEPSAVANPLDQLSSADIAVTAARMVSVPEVTAITNQADSQAAELTMAPTTDTVVTKPQVVSTSLKSKADIKVYESKAGDTLNDVAVKFGVTTNSIRWSNSMTSDTLTAGQKLTIPPVNGFVYTVQSGDTPESLATKYKASKDKIVVFNDAEIKGLVPGQQVVIPDGTKEVATTARQILASGAVTTGYAWGGSPVYGYNGYDYGYCTWYVATRLSVPANWGNANTWDNFAPSAGWTVSSTPVVGAIAQSDRGYYGHVAFVEAVSEDGTQIKYSDMNGLAGFGRVGHSDWVDAGHFSHYIYR